ncbi:protein of unknown function [Nitrosomonas sp. Nm51]|uniref:DUF4112 domain-containing protein n=1 Tax=Nitrosomonas sp. Nm51 TaxID=133720 RepID=UPI0008BE4083|nr:DUF4112 domain-containing protein [Nitrosomonas sp. Nm51]SEQ96929.1 protein of unknown function [Nitrosomonas sp. Nm51]
MNDTHRKYSTEKLNRLAWLLDNSIRIPGTDIRFGLDGLIGLIPGLGDAIGAIISTHILTQAAQLGAPKSLLIRMGFNIGLDTLLGIIPVIGDLADFAFKANYRNVQLLNAYLGKPGKTALHSQLFIGAIAFLVLGTVLLIGFFGFLLMRWLWLSVQGG